MGSSSVSISLLPTSLVSFLGNFLKVLDTDVIVLFSLAVER